MEKAKNNVIVNFPLAQPSSSILIGNLQLQKYVPVKHDNIASAAAVAANEHQHSTSSTSLLFYNNTVSDDICQELVSDSHKLCSEKGLVLPFWEPTDHLSRVFIAILYLLSFAYIFLGVSLLSGRVMMSVEVITSKLKVVSMIRDRYGKMRPVTRPFWSDVIKNLTLYVLGFSAPEILITLVEIAKHNFEKADLGPETIVGSRAYHLFIITAICIVSAGNQAKRVRRLRVYIITSFWAIFAYLWIYLIISLSSREVIDIWEALVTFTFYPVVVLTAWLFEKYNIFRRHQRPRRSRSAVARRSTMIRRQTSSIKSSSAATTATRSSQLRSGRRIQRGGNVTPAKINDSNSNNNSSNNNNNNKSISLSQLGVKIITSNNNSTSDGNEAMAQTTINNNEMAALAPASVANYSLMTQSLAGNADPLVLKENAYFLNGSINEDQQNNAEKDVEDAGATGEDDGEDGEDDGDGEDETVTKAERNAQRELLWVRLKALKDRFPGRSQLELETMAEMSYLQDMPKNQSYYRIMTTRNFTGEGHVITKEKIRQKLLVGVAAPPEVKETKVNEKRRRLRVGEQRVFFCPAHYVVVECEPHVELKIMREGAISRAIEVAYETVDGTASAGEDYVETKGKVVFQPNETVRTIQVRIIDDEEFEDDEYFTVRITAANYIEQQNENGEQTSPAANNISNLAGAANRSIRRLRSLRMTASSNKPIEIGPQNEACVTILDDDHCGVFTFPGASLVVPDNLKYAEIKVVRSLGAHGRIIVPFELTPINAILDKDYYEPITCKILFEHRDLEKTIKIGIVNRQRAGDDSVFMLKLLEPSLINEPPPKRAEGLPRVGDQATIRVIITESDEIKDTLDRLQTVGDLGSLFRTTWRTQFYDAINLQTTSFVQQDDGAMIGAVRPPSWWEYLIHAISLPWKLIFAALPPTGILDGWVAFFSCIIVVGVISILIEDLSAHFGCVCGIDKPITAITIVAIGTSLPDMFASRAAAVHEKTADAALAHISGSNAVNVYLGLGLAWTIASLHHRFIKGAVDYKPTCFPQHLAANVLLFFAFSIAGMGVLTFRRFSPWSGRAELGGPLRMRLLTAGILVLLYVCYITLTILVSENILVVNV